MFLIVGQKVQAVDHSEGVDRSGGLRLCFIPAYLSRSRYAVGWHDRIWALMKNDLHKVVPLQQKRYSAAASFTTPREVSPITSPRLVSMDCIMIATANRKESRKRNGTGSWTCRQPLFVWFRPEATQGTVQYAAVVS